MLKKYTKDEEGRIFEGGVELSMHDVAERLAGLMKDGQSTGDMKPW